MKKEIFKGVIYVLDAVKIQYPGSVDTDITSVIKIWLVKAKERLARKPQNHNGTETQELNVTQPREPNLTQDVN